MGIPNVRFHPLKCFFTLIITTIITTTNIIGSTSTSPSPLDNNNEFHRTIDPPPPVLLNQPKINHNEVLHDTTLPPKAPTSSPTSTSSFFVLCLTDGTIVSIDAWTGIHSSVVHTEPLVQRHYNNNINKNKNNHNSNNNEMENDNNRILILPGLDGRLYYRPPSEVAVRDDITRSEGVISEAPSLPLQELPITMGQLLENPVRSCQPVDLLNVNNNENIDMKDEEVEEECGILSAQTETSLLALSAKSGAVQWRSGYGSKDNNKENEHNQSKETNNKNEPVLLLQRKDHFVQYVQINDGKQLWNVSLGNYQALDFDLPTTTTTTTTSGGDTTTAAPGGASYTTEGNILMLDNDDDITNNANNFHASGQSSSSQSVLLLPVIVLQNDGRTLVAIKPTNDDNDDDDDDDDDDQMNKQKILWRQDVPSTLANVFGIANGKWQTIPIITNTASNMETTRNENNAVSKTVSSTPDVPHYRLTELDEYEQFLWNQRWSSSSSSSLVATSMKSQSKYDPSTATTILSDSATGMIDVVDDGASLCWIDEYEQWGTCINNMNELLRPLLTLPSGPPASVIVVQSDGILLSWSIIVAMMLVLIVSIYIIGRFWYMGKKAQWMMMYSTSKANDNTVTTINQSDQATTPSLPLIDETTKKNSSSGERLLQPSDRTNSNDNSNTIDGTIPLVRYSRYASEFQELRPLGKGGFGSVFQCENTLDGRQYAIKKVSIYSKNHDHFQQQLQRVLREVKILAVLDHPNIVRYYTAWLEIEEGHHLPTRNDTTIIDEDSTTNGIISPRKNYSSSILCTSQLNDEIIWDKTKTAKADHSYHNTISNPLGWNNGLDLSDNSSLFLSRRQSLRDLNNATDEYVIFEDSLEGDSPNSSFVVSRENRTDSNSQRIKPQEIILRQSKQNSSVLEGEIDDSSTFFKPENTSVARTLYIQMQLCSHKTLAEFLTDRRARSGSLTNAIVDIPKALRIFIQISDAAAHVHECGLIHRDLKPNNCFMDDACTTVKVGDFGLSRESKIDDDPSCRDENSVQHLNIHEDHTAGVGTRSYASPEQMNGSMYDSSTDVYSLGMMLFELLYPMYTGMERQICFNRLRENCFPNDWSTHVGIGFPTIKDLIMTMLSRTPSRRPSAESVSRHIQSILGEFTLMSLDEHYHQRSDIALLRVEAGNHENILQHVMQLIQYETAANDRNVEIVQYGMRSTIAAADETATAIMEFAVRDKINSDSPLDKFVSQLVSNLVQHPEIIKARVIHNASTNFP